MENINIKLTLVQKIAILWLKNVDSSLAMFNTLKQLQKPIRYLFYTGLIAFSIFIMKFVGAFVDLSNVTAGNFIELIGSIVFWGVAIGITFIWSLESVYKLDVAKILEQIKVRKKEIKELKLQKWRLINMNIFMRIFIYLSLYMLSFLIINSSAQGAFLHLFGAADLSNPVVQNQVKIFVTEFENIVQWFTFLYVISAITLDYFVSKKRDQRKEVQNETV